MGQEKAWSDKEYEYLMDRWGTISIPGIAKHLNRSINAVKIKAHRLGLGPFLEAGTYVTLNQLMLAITGSPVHKYTLKSWVEKRGLPIHNQKHGECSVRVVYIDEFWKWAEKNRSFLDFSRIEPLILGAEPEWVAEQRKKDFAAHPLQRKDKWTPAEDERLKFLLKKYEYGWSEISKMLGRTEGAIQRRCIDLGIKERPIKADNHGSSVVWTDTMYNIVADGIRHGDSYAEIARQIGKSEKAVRGKVYAKYLTESADKVRGMIGDGKWGDGAPEPTVRQAIHLSHYSAECKKMLAAMAGLLRYRMNDIGYEPYWQRYMCMKWDDFKGCLANCTNCDECTEFERIKPQYCARCGSTFYERAKNRFCQKCRMARKKQTQKKWCILNRR